MRPGLLAASAALVIAVGVSTWLAAAEYVAMPLGGDVEPRQTTNILLTGPDAAAVRLDALRRAEFTLPPTLAAEAAAAVDPLPGPIPTCRLIPEYPSGTTPKFDCVLSGGEVVKIKYGHDAEIHGEAAATALLQMLGYAADSVTIVERIRCHGCPRHPFVAMHLRRTFHLPFVREEIDNGYTDFEWASVEQKFPAPAIETEAVEGWEWWELDQSLMPRAEVDAFRLLAAFIAHWDNKAQNQRLVCLDDLSRHATREGGCERPLAMIQDLGASFGPPKVNLARWRDLPVWYDRTTCTLSMRALPFEGATFRDAQISEEGRALMAGRLGAISDAQIEHLFAAARVPHFQAGTDDQRDLKAWTQAFRSRVRQIAEARCPATSARAAFPSRPSPRSSS